MPGWRSGLGNKAETSVAAPVKARPLITTHRPAASLFHIAIHLLTLFQGAALFDRPVTHVTPRRAIGPPSTVLPAISFLIVGVPVLVSVETT